MVYLGARVFVCKISSYMGYLKGESLSHFESGSLGKSNEGM